MTFKPGDAIWAHSDGTHIARGWHRGIVTGAYRGFYTVMLTEYGCEVRSRPGPLSIRLRQDEGELNLPVRWHELPWQPDKNWKPRQREAS